jgi:hypothetical protein
VLKAPPPQAVRAPPRLHEPLGDLGCVRGQQSSHAGSIPSSREVDFYVIQKGRCAAIEVDGSSHYQKWSSDRSKDQALEDAGAMFVSRIDAADVEVPERVRPFLARFFLRLAG